MNKENCALKLVDEIILYYDARSKKHQIKMHTMTGLFSDAALNPQIVYCGIYEEKHNIIIIIVVFFLSSNRPIGLTCTPAIS